MSQGSTRLRTFHRVPLRGPHGPSAREPQNRWGFGTDLGFTTGTVNGTVFTLGFNADYYLDRAFSVGPMLLLSSLADLTQIAMAGVAGYHVHTGRVNVMPFAGFGLIHADLDRGSGPGRIDRNDTSWYIPINPKLALASTLIVNLHDINLQPTPASVCCSAVALDHSPSGFH